MTGFTRLTRTCYDHQSASRIRSDTVNLADFTICFLDVSWISWSTYHGRIFDIQYVWYRTHAICHKLYKYRYHLLRWGLGPRHAGADDHESLRTHIWSWHKKKVISEYWQLNLETIRKKVYVNYNTIQYYISLLRFSLIPEGEKGRDVEDRTP
jgi:hypothetical protein